MLSSDVIITLRDELESLYPGSAAGSLESLLSLSDDLLTWLLSVLREEPVSAPIGENDQWSRLLSSLSSHYILPLIWYNLRKKPESVLPPPWVREVLQEAYRNASMRTLRTEEQIARFCIPLRDAGIEPVILKGPALGHLVFPYPALRTGSDIDILVPEEKVKETLACFEKLGYSPHVDSHGASAHAFHHVTLLPPDRSVALAVEVHWRLLFLPGEITPPLDEMLSRTVQVQGDIASFSALDTPDSLIYAATHMTIGHPQMIRLSWVADIAFLAEYLTRHDAWETLFSRTGDGVLLAAVQRACKEAGFWFSPGARYVSPGFFPVLAPLADERFGYLSAVVGRPDRHLVEVFRESKSLREGLISAFHVLFMTNEIDWAGAPFRVKIEYFKEWVRMVFSLLQKRIISPSSGEDRGRYD